VLERGAADERLLPVDRVGEDHRHRQHVLVADVVLDHGGHVAMGHAVAPHEPRLQVRGRDGEHAPFPPPRREPARRMRRAWRRMRPAVHPHVVRRAIDGAAHVKRHHAAGDRIELLLDAEILRPHHDVLRRVEDALPLGHVLHRHLVGIGHRAGFVVDRQPCVVADMRPGRAFDPVLVQAVGPRAGEVDGAGLNPCLRLGHAALREDRCGDDDAGERRQC
jgi:hypothetical protein